MGKALRLFLFVVASAFLSSCFYVPAHETGIGIGIDATGDRAAITTRALCKYQVLAILSEPSLRAESNDLARQVFAA